MDTKIYNEKKLEEMLISYFKWFYIMFTRRMYWSHML